MGHKASPSLWGLILTSFVVASLALAYRRSPQELTSVRRANDQADRLLHDVLSGLDRATVFFSQDYSSINVDGLFGIRIAQGTIQQSLTWCHLPKSTCPPDVLSHLGKLNTTFATMAEKAMPYVQSQDPEYFSAFSKTIDAPYLIEPDRKSLPEKAAGTETSYNEKVGDRCLASLMGTWEENGQPVPVCSVDEACITLMTKPHQADYSITHQLLFFIMAEKNGCTDKLDRLLSDRGLGGVKEFERQLCGHIYSEVKEETKAGQVDEVVQDLFLEQSTLCGVIGFPEFSTPALIRMVLSWQTTTGCFTLSRDWMSLAESMGLMSPEQKHLLQLLTEEERNIKQSTWTGRKLMREQVMQNDCLSHKSGLGIGMLGVYQRNLLQRISTTDK